MPQYTNQNQVPLSLAVWLSKDSYDYIADPNHISATTLLKPIRQTILKQRIPREANVIDISSLVNSRMGTAIHDSIERAWLGDYAKGLESLGYPKGVIDRIVVNPDPATVTDDQIPVYMEIRSFKEIEGYKVSGKFDFVGNGRLEDFKSTGVYSLLAGNKDQDYIDQGSIYRWLNPDIITEDHMAIQFIFTDWSAAQAKMGKDKGYPQSRTHQHLLPLKTIEETEFWVRSRLRDLTRFKHTPEPELPECSDKELWRKDPVWKYYKNPQKMSRSTKNFDNEAEAMVRLGQDGGTGIVVKQEGEVVACRYCDAFPVCSQKDKYLATGELRGMD